MLPLPENKWIFVTASNSNTASHSIAESWFRNFYRIPFCWSLNTQNVCISACKRQLRTDWPTYKCCSRGNLLHYGPQASHSSIATSTKICTSGCFTQTYVKCFTATTTPSYPSAVVCATFGTVLMVQHRWYAWAPLIFRAGWFGKWVCGHSWADSHCQGHRLAVFINQLLLWCPLAYT